MEYLNERPRGNAGNGSNDCSGCLCRTYNHLGCSGNTLMNRVKRKVIPLHNLRVTTNELIFLLHSIRQLGCNEGWEDFKHYLLLSKLERNIPKHLKEFV